MQTLLGIQNWDSVKSPVPSQSLELKTWKTGSGLLYLAMCTQRSRDGQHLERDTVGGKREMQRGEHYSFRQIGRATSAQGIFFSYSPDGFSPFGATFYAFQFCEVTVFPRNNNSSNNKTFFF